MADDDIFMKIMVSIITILVMIVVFYAITDMENRKTQNKEANKKIQEDRKIMKDFIKSVNDLKNRDRMQERNILEGIMNHQNAQRENEWALRLNRMLEKLDNEKVENECEPLSVRYEGDKKANTKPDVPLPTNFQWEFIEDEVVQSDPNKTSGTWKYIMNNNLPEFKITYEMDLANSYNFDINNPWRDEYADVRYDGYISDNVKPDVPEPPGYCWVFTPSDLPLMDPNQTVGWWRMVKERVNGNN